MRFPPHKPGSLAAQAAAGARATRTRDPLREPWQLTPAERKALRRSASKGGTPAAGTNKTVRDRLLDAGWVTQPEDALLITKTGRSALNAVIPEKQRAGITVTVQLKHRHGTTTSNARAMRDAGDVLDIATLNAHWAEETERQHHAARDARTEARKRQDRARRAA